MVQFRTEDHLILFKLVYYGPALGGKTTSLKSLHSIVDPEGKGQLVSLKTQEDRTLFFDFLPLKVEGISGYDIQFQLYTVPGQVQYDVMRRHVLAGADGIIFVADSQPGRSGDNLISWENMRANLMANNLDLNNMPVVLQANKQDIEHPSPPEAISEHVKAGPDRPVIATCALTGDGVLKSFLILIKRVMSLFLERYMKDRGISTEGVQQMLSSRFEPLLEKRLVPELAESPASLPIVALDEEKQLIEAIQAQDALAQEVNSVRQMVQKYEKRLEEMQLLFWASLQFEETKDPRLAIRDIAGEIRRVRTTWAVSSLFGNQESISEVHCVGLEKDPLEGIQFSNESLLETHWKEDDVILLEDIKEKWVALQVPDPPPLHNSAVIPLGGKKSRISLVIHALISGPPLEEEDLRFFRLFQRMGRAQVVRHHLEMELASWAEDLEKRVVERTADLTRALEALKRAERHKEIFLNGVSHEMKTPLTNIRSYAEMLITMPPDDPEEVKGFLEVILSESERLGQTIDEMLDFSKLKKAPRGEQVDLGKLVGEIQKELTPYFSERECEVILDIPEKPVIYAINHEDARVLIRHPLQNAAKFATGTTIRVYLVADEKRVALAVRDRGKGILEPEMDRLKGIFEQGDLRAGKIPGLGLGLALVHACVTKYDGVLHLENTNPGLSVLVELPRP